MITKLTFDFDNTLGLVERFKQKCLEENLSTSKVVEQLVKMWADEDVYIPQTVEDDICLKIYELFKELCPNIPRPDFNEQLTKEMKTLVVRVHQKPDYYVNLFKKVASIPWTEVFTPKLVWLLKLENALKVMTGDYDWLISRRDRAKQADERRKVKEVERAEKERLRKEEAERKAKMKAEAARIKQEKLEAEAKLKAWKLEMVVKEKEEKERLKLEKENKCKDPEEEEPLYEMARDESDDAERFAGNVEEALD